jgi:hypothetical protein
MEIIDNTLKTNDMIRNLYMSGNDATKIRKNSSPEISKEPCTYNVPEMNIL